MISRGLQVSKNHVMPCPTAGFPTTVWDAVRTTNRWNLTSQHLTPYFVASGNYHNTWGKPYSVGKGYLK